MTGKTWQAPIFIELDDLEGSPKEAPKKVTYKAPESLPEETSSKDDTVALFTASAETTETVAAVQHQAKPDFASAAPNSEAVRPAALPEWTREKITVPPAATALKLAGISPWYWLFGGLAALLVFLTILDTLQLIERSFNSSLVMGMGVLLASLAVIGGAGTLIWRSWQDIVRLRSITTLQKQGQTLIDNNEYGHGMDYINELASLYAGRQDVNKNLDRFFLMASSAHQDREVCTLFSHQVLKPLDEQAYRLVMQRSNEAALMTMLSPTPLLSSALTLWRTMRMIRDVATLYGGRPGLVGSSALIGTVVQNLIYADVSEVMAESVAETFGGSMMSIISTNVAQGIGSSVLTARVGLYAMRSCRPLPFSEEERPRLKHIRQEIIKNLKQMLMSRNEVSSKAAR